MKTDVRESSVDAYDELKVRGKVGTQAQLIRSYVVACALAGQENCTLQEISRGTGLPINTVSGRVNDCKKAGALFEWPRRKCSVTGSNVIPVGYMPAPPEQLSLLERAA